MKQGTLLTMAVVAALAYFAYRNRQDIAANVVRQKMKPGEVLAWSSDSGYYATKQTSLMPDNY